LTLGNSPCMEDRLSAYGGKFGHCVSSGIRNRDLIERISSGTGPRSQGQPPTDRFVTSRCMMTFHPKLDPSIGSIQIVRFLIGWELRGTMAKELDCKLMSIQFNSVHLVACTEGSLFESHL
jgi:hypothetical protein